MSVKFCDECGSMMKQIMGEWVCESCSSDDFQVQNEHSNGGSSSQGLEAIDSVGSSRAAALRNAGYHDIEDVQAASRSELTRVKGIGSTLASRINRNAKDITSNESIETYSSTSDSSDDQSNGSSTETVKNQSSVEHIRETAEIAVSAAEEAKENGDFEKAKQEYEKALDQYQTAKYEFTTEHTQFSPPIAEAIDQISDQIELLEQHREKRATLINTIQTAETRFQEAIVAFIKIDKLLSRVRFRQARDQFTDALKIIESSDINLLSPKIEFTVDPEYEFNSNKLQGLNEIDDELIGVLKKEGVKETIDLQSNRYLELTPEILVDLSEREIINEKIKTELSVLSWYQEETRYEFKQVEQLQLRIECAKHGFGACI